MPNAFYVLSVQLEWNDQRPDANDACPFDSRDTYILGVTQDADMARRWVHETDEVDGVPVYASVFAQQESAGDFRERNWYKNKDTREKAPPFIAMLFAQEGEFITTTDQLTEDAASSVGNFKEYCGDRSRLWDAVIEE